MEGKYSKALDQIYSLCFKKTMYTTKEKLIDRLNAQASEMVRKSEMPIMQWLEEENTPDGYDEMIEGEIEQIQLNK